MIGRYVRDLHKRETPRRSGRDHLFWFHPQLRLGAARLAQYDRFLTRPLVPIHNGKAPGGLKSGSNRPRKARAIRHAMKHVRHEYKVSRLAYQFCYIVSIADHKIAVGHALLGKAPSRDFEQGAVNIDRGDVSRELGDLQREPAITRA